MADDQDAESGNADELTETEYLNEEFENMVRVANAAIRTFKRPKDSEIANSILRKCEGINQTGNESLQKLNNNFFRYFLKVLNWTSTNQPLEHYAKWYEEEEDKPKMGEFHQYLKTGKTYMASKSLGDGNLLVYMAVSTGEGGWQEGGLKWLQQDTLCQEKPAETEEAEE